MHPLEEYLRALHANRFIGVKETSNYPALSRLFDEVGRSLKPRVRCVVHPRGQGAGLPDGGLYTQEQFPSGDAEPLPGQLPARGAVEVKGTGENLQALIASEQVRRYWQTYRLVLVTNLWEFVLMGQDAAGSMAALEGYRLAGGEGEFWAADPRQMAAAQGERFVEFLRRVMLHAAPLAAPQDLAWFLASYARDARLRIESVELQALTAVRAALEEALGLSFQGERGEHFFRSTLVQTLFYGVFSAWVLWSSEHAPESAARFNWHEAAYLLRVPMISALFEQVAQRSKLEPLGLVEVLDWAGAENAS